MMTVTEVSFHLLIEMLESYLILAQDIDPFLYANWEAS